MPWHLRLLDWQCSSLRCAQPATHELYNAANAPSGKYCEKHAKAALARVLKEAPISGD